MIDGHCHLDRNIGSCEDAVCYLHGEAVNAGVKGVVLLNLPEIAFPNDDVIEATRRYGSFFSVFPALDPTQSKPNALLERYKASGAVGLKLHPRLHNYKIDDGWCVEVVRHAGRLNMAVMVDCFPDGNNLALGNIPEAFMGLADKAPEARIAIGHAGGHRILDALMIAKRYNNLYLDISYSLLYYRNSSVINDIAYVVKSMNGKRMFWGTDYPDRPYSDSVRFSRNELERMDLTEFQRDAVLHNTVKEFLNL